MQLQNLKLQFYNNLSGIKLIKFPDYQGAFFITTVNQNFNI